MSAMPVHATPSMSQSIASTSSTPDAFDAVVQAANPSHPNHAAWVEKYGGTHSRKASSKGGEDGAADEHAERGSIASQRRRRASNATTKSHGATSLAIITVSPEKERRADTHSRHASNASNQQTLSHSASQKRLVEGAPALQMDGSHSKSPELSSQRKSKKKRDKGKERGALPPVPPPRTTSQIVLQPSPPTDVPFSQVSISSSSRQHGITSVQTHPGVGFLFSPSTSVSPMYDESTHSQNTSLSHHTLATSPGPTNGQSPRDVMVPPKKSSLRPRHPAATGTNEPPARLSSMLSRTDAADEEQRLARAAAATAMPQLQAPSQSPPLPPLPRQALSRRDSHKSVEFALPEEPKRRGSFDTYGLRKSFDTLVSPFRDGKKQSQRSVPSAAKIGDYAPPILKSSTSSDRHAASGSPMFNQAEYASLHGRPLSCVMDENEMGEGQVKGENGVSVAPAIALHPVSAVAIPLLPQAQPSASPRGGDLSEDGDDFYDAQSDEGGNGSSADDADASRKFTSSSKHIGGDSSRKKSGRKHLEHHHATKTRTTPAVAGLGVDGLPPTMPLNVPAGSPVDKMESSASEIESRMTHEGPRKVLHQESNEERSKMKESQDATSKGGSSVPVNSSAARDTPVVSSAVTPLSGHAVRGSGSGLPGVTQAFFVSGNAPIREGLGEEGQLKYPFETSPGSYFFPGSSSSRSMSNWNSEGGVTSPLASNRTFAFPTSQSMQQTKSKDGSSKSFGKSSKGGLAGVMARMRRDRSTGGGNNKNDNNNSSSKGTTTTSPDFYAGSPALTLVEQPEEREANGKSVGLGIAASTSPEPSGVEGGLEVPSKKWRNRLTSFSGKANKSPRVNVGSEEGKFVDTLPQMPAKAKKLLGEGSAASHAESQTQARSPISDDSNTRSLSRRPSVGVKDRSVETSSVLERGGPHGLKKAKSSIDFRETTSPTIHKTLSPALLTEQKHEVDEAASFIGSDKDTDSKRETWNSLSNFELPPDQHLLSSATQATPSPTSVERSLLGTEEGQELGGRNGNYYNNRINGGEADDSLANEPASHHPSLTARRFSNGASQPRNKTSDGPPRRLAPSALNLSSRPPPSPPVPRSSSVASSTIWDQQPAPTSRRSLDARSAFRSISAGFPQSGGRKESVDYARRAGSFALDREAAAASSPFFPPTAAEMKSPSLSMGGLTPKFGKRIFSGGSKNKSKLKGISSNDFYIASGGEIGGFPLASKSEISLHSPAVRHAVFVDENQQQQQHGGVPGSDWSDAINSRRRVEEMDNDLQRAHEATKLLASTAETMVNTPTTATQPTVGGVGNGSLHSAQMSPTTTLNNHHHHHHHQPHHIPDEEASAFDRMLRETAKEDAARLRQISTRAQRSPV